MFVSVRLSMCVSISQFMSVCVSLSPCLCVSLSLSVCVRVGAPHGWAEWVEEACGCFLGECMSLCLPVAAGIGASMSGSFCVAGHHMSLCQHVSGCVADCPVCVISMSPCVFLCQPVTEYVLESRTEPEREGAEAVSGGLHTWDV